MIELKKLLESILKFASNKWYPDIHINTTKLPLIRDKTWNINEIKKIEIDWNEINFEILTKEFIRLIIKDLVWEVWLEKFEKEKELDSSYSLENYDRYRVNCYIDSNWYSIALRVIPSKIPTLEELWLWNQIKEMCNRSKWLILVTWPTWSWKSTNLAAMINYINKNFKKHIITIEDPIEFSFKSDKSLINQRELWNHTSSFMNAMKSSLREDPDIIMLWEMRDPETIKTAITLAETWHLVFSTLHTNDSVQTIDRIVDVFPNAEWKQVRIQLAMSLVWVIAQRLVPRIDNKWRIAAREILVSTDAVRNLIITWKTHQLYSVLEIWQKSWMILMDKYLVALFNKWIISKEILLLYVRDKEWIELLIN